MRKILFLVLIPIFFIFVQKVSAEPIISNVALQPENAWLNENVSISLDCYDPTGTITKVYGKLVDPVFSDNLDFDSASSNHYTLTLMSLYFDPSKPPKYTFSVYCQNDNNQTTNTSISFNVSQIKTNISYIKTPTYIGDIVEMDVYIEKDKLPFYSDDISFNLKLGGQNWPKTFFYDPGKNNWIIKFNVPNVLGTYDLSLEINFNLATYNPKKITLESSIEVKDAVEFKVLSVDKTEVNPNDVITVALSASDRGNNIILNKNYLSFKVGPVTIDPTNISISSAGNYFNVKVPMPYLSPDYYDFQITFNYGNYSTTNTINVGYLLPVSGKFIDYNDKGISVEIKFLIGDTEKKKLYTDSSGSYSGYVVPGNYTIQLVFPQSTLYLYSVKINEFNDPIKYYFVDTSLIGIKSAGTFIYDVAIPYSKAKIIINYDEKKIPSEKNLLAYSCNEWDSENKLCSMNWNEQAAIIDTIRNIVTIETNDLHTYTIGMKKSLYIDFGSEKNIFNLKELVKLRGVVRDESGNFVQDILLNGRVNGMDINVTVFSNSNGIFVLEFFTPEEEGVYNLLVKAEKSPYLSGNKTWIFQVIKNRNISLLVPDTIRIKKGDNQTLQFSVVNTGQADVSDLSLSLTGLPQDYFSLQKKIDQIKIGQEVKVPVYFKVPQDAGESTLSITFKVSSNEVTNEEIIGFTIFSENVTAQIATDQKSFPTFKFPTANIALPVSINDISYAIAFCIISVLIMYLLKYTKNHNNNERKHVKNLLLDIKSEIRREKFAHPAQSFNQLVRHMEEKNKKENNN